ncbi:MAG: serine protease [Acidobacteria bacterium]|nr:MAG: serine protease [Acidobacteriota bacterium]PYQ24306.1 MAG: serine protease [Acidobacteriota bacterium]
MKRLVLLVACGILSAVAARAGGPIRRAEEPIRDRYLVVLKPGVARNGRAAAGNAPSIASVAGELARGRGVVERLFDHVLLGFSARMPAAVAALLAADPRVDYVEEDGHMGLVATEIAPLPWGLDRIDQHLLPLSTNYSYTSTGLGVTAYIIDTGIRFSHSEFAGRAVTGFDAVDGGSADDCNGHGTHVSGTVGGTTYGVAKQVTLVAVRVLDCNGSGSTSGVIAGVDWVAGDHAPGTPAVANMSLGGGASRALDTAVSNSIADGVSYAIAAGNGNVFGFAKNACRTSPARVPEAMTVSATDITDTKPIWANYGDCVDWFAPGVGIKSAWNTSDTASNTISGTSMATPHTTGVAALYLQSHPSATPAEVRDALFAATTKGVVTKSRTTNNNLLFTDY